MKNQIYINNLIGLLSEVDEVKGDIIEIGTFKGDSSEIICNYLHLNNISKKYFGLDTFNGYIEEDLKEANLSSLNNQKSGRWKASKAEVENRIKNYNVISSIYEGDSKIIIPNLIKTQKLKKLSFIYIDCNLFPPSIKAMNDLFPLLNKNGILAIDEHTIGGETKAIKKFSSNNNLELLYYSKQPGPSYYIKKQ